MKKAVYPGSFDPISIGHLDIIKRSAKLFDEVHVLVSNNFNKSSYSFTALERCEMIKMVTKDIPNVKVVSSDDLVVKYAMENHINTIVRGLRNYQDYEAEFSLYQFNRDINKDIETILLMPSKKNQCVSSSAIRELVFYGIDISNYVPVEVKDIIVKKLAKKD